MEGLLGKLRSNRTRIIILAILILFYILAVRGMSTKDWVLTTLRGFSVGAVIFLVAAGFSLILGLMGVLNLAQGTLYMIGAYVGWSFFVRPDTFVDLLTPLLLVASGFWCMPLFDWLLSRLKAPRTLARIWPWIGLLLAAVVLLFGLSAYPIALWDAEVYDNSPIVWTQHFEDGLIAEILEPAEFVDVAPIVSLGGILLGSLLVALSLAGLQHARGQGSARGAGRRGTPWRAVIGTLVLIVLALTIYLLNDALTGFLLGFGSLALFIFAVVVATLICAGLGALMEATLIRPLYERHTYQIMMTFGLAFIGTEVVFAIWGRSGFTMPRPSLFANTADPCPASSIGGWLQHQCRIMAITIGGETARIRTYNEIFVILVGLLVLIVVWLLIQRTRLGMIIRAGVQDSEMVEALAINVRRVFTLVFAIGVGIAGLGGVISAPSTGLSPAMGSTLLLGALIALAIGGLTSLPGAAAGAVIVGLVQQFIIKYGQIGIQLPFMAEPFKPTPPLVPASTILLMVIILVLMPQGLFGRKE